MNTKIIIFGTIMILPLIYNIFLSIKRKQLILLWSILLIVPFLVFALSGILLGGSAFNDASTKYEFYKSGHYYLVNHNVYTEVTYNEFIYMKVIEIIAIVTFFIGFILQIIIQKKSIKKGNNKPGFSNEKLENDFKDVDYKQYYKEKKIFISLSKQSFFKFLICIIVVSTIFTFLILNWDWFFILFLFVLVWFVICGILMSFSRCTFTKDKISARADCFVNIQQAQKKFSISYKDIESIEIIRLPLHYNTQNNEILKLHNESNKYEYFIYYLSYNLDCIKIKLKDSEKVEGIILNNYSKKQQKMIYNELLNRIKVSNK